MEVGMVQKIDIDQEMQQAYLDYAMSVIVSRALPDARDGLKPVHRRILYAMYDMGLRPDSGYKKSARIVGEVLGKYHPHGDMAVYDAMARMAQNFSMRCPLVDGQGNFGSMDGDPPAAMRYTEARMAAPAAEMLADINKDTVDFDVNFDDTLKEPTVLPAAIPNLLVNGATGIAVGMSTSIPPHNLGEVVDALVFLLQKWDKIDDIDLAEILKFIQGPDFPTGGIIIQSADNDVLASAYGTGRGRITVQARAHIEEMERGRHRLIITELPYMSNKSSLIERIADLVRDERLVGIADLRDESDRQGMRIVIELTKTADPQTVLQELFRLTPMQGTFSIIMLALVNGEPRLLTLKQALRVYLDHRLVIIRRRSQHDLEKARQRAHILEGLLVALRNLDEVISIIRRSRTAETARSSLMRRYKLSQIQAQAILDMPLRRLASLERKKIELEYKEIKAEIKKLESLLRSPKKIRQLIANELLAVKEAYGDRRRTQIVHLKKGAPKQTILTTRDLIPEKFVWLSATRDGMLACTLEDRIPRQSGSEAPNWLLRVNTRDTLYVVTKTGKAAALPLHSIPEAEKPSAGIQISKISPLSAQDQIAAIFTLPPKKERADNWYVLSATRQGMVKKTEISELPGPSANTFTLVRVNAGDQLGWLNLTNGETDVLLLTAHGMAIRFSENEVRPMGLVAAGVNKTGDVFMVASNGSAKRVAVSHFPKQGRYGQGVAAWKLPAKNRAIGLTIGKGTQRVTLHLKKLAPKMTRLDAAPLQGRAARGKIIQKLKAGDEIVQLTAPWRIERPLATQPKSSTRRRRTSTRTATKGKKRSQKPSTQEKKPSRTAPKGKRSRAKKG